jgi:hypothetical protein
MTMMMAPVKTAPRKSEKPAADAPEAAAAPPPADAAPAPEPVEEAPAQEPVEEPAAPEEPAAATESAPEQTPRASAG